MSTQIQRRRNTASNLASFSGALAEFTYNTDTNRIHSHDGSTAGGFPHALLADTFANGETIKTSAYTVTAADNGKVIILNKATADTLSFDAAADLGPGFRCLVKCIGAGTWALDPDGSETIDGLTTLSLAQGQSTPVTCNGTLLRAYRSGVGDLVSGDLGWNATEQEQGRDNIGHGVFKEGAAPSTSADEGVLYTKDAGGQPELFFREESDGDEVQITKGGQTLGQLALSASVATTSGTAIDFTSIPAGVKAIHLHLNQVSLNAIDYPVFQIGDSGGVETSGYVAGYSGASGSGLFTASFTTGFYGPQIAATKAVSGTLTFRLTDEATNTWSCGGVLWASPDTLMPIAGIKPLSGELDRVRITSDGPSTFDGGSASISWEF